MTYKYHTNTTQIHKYHPNTQIPHKHYLNTKQIPLKYHTNTTQIHKEVKIWPKLPKNNNSQNAPKMVLNVKENCPNEARNTNTKFPGNKW